MVSPCGRQGGRILRLYGGGWRPRRGRIARLQGEPGWVDQEKGFGDGVVALDVGTLRELFRHLHQFRAVFEDDGVDTISDPDGMEWSLWDLEYLYREGLPLLPERQWQAIELCLVRNIKESTAAVKMGVSVTNPVSAYATSGLEKLIGLIHQGELPRFRSVPVWGDAYVLRDAC